MKKIYLLLALATSLFATSCSQDELAGETAGKSSTVTFTVELPKEVSSSRAFGDGTTATTLSYAVYQVTGEEGNEVTQYLPALTPTPENEKTFQNSTSVSIDLVHGKKYMVAFWADAQDNGIYSFEPENKKITINYNNAFANQEKYDAFYGVTEPFTATGAPQEVTLTRPFAQLNIGAGDIDKAINAGLITKETIYDEEVKVEVTIDNAFNAIDILTGEVTGETTEITFEKYDVVPEINDFPVGGYTYLAMNYILVPVDYTIYTVNFKVYDGDTEAISRNFNSVPVQRNYKTNVYGKLFTTSTDVTIDLKPDFGQEVENRLYVFNAVDLQNAINAATGETTIYLGANIEGDVTVVQKPGVNIIIDGCKANTRSNTNDIKYNGSIKVHSNSNNYADAALTIKNVNFETSEASINVIEALENGAERYSTNITVENCTFTATGEAVNTAVGVQIKSSKNAKVLNCTATNMHSLIQAQSCDETIVVNNCTINGKNGVAFKQVKAATVEGTTITALEYGIRFDGNTDNYGIVVKNNNVTAVQPFIVRKMTGKDNTITLEGTNTLTTEEEYQIIITNGSDDEEYVKPTGTYTLTGADAYTVFPPPFPVATWDEFTAALAAGETDIKLTADITYDANYQLQKSVTLNLGGYSMTLPMINIHTKTTIKNGTINGKVYARKNSESTFDNVTFSGAVSDNLSTEGHLAIQGGCKSLYAKDCLFSPTSVSGSQTKPLSFEGGSTIMKFENCEFKSSPYKKQVYLNSLSATGSLDFTNCNFNNKTPNIMFAATCPLTNLTMSGTTKLSSVTLETNRAKDAVTAEDLAYLRESLIANNSMSSVRLFYAGGSSEYIK